jgi:hypothetical protein
MAAAHQFGDDVREDCTIAVMMPKRKKMEMKKRKKEK